MSATKKTYNLFYNPKQEFPRAKYRPRLSPVFFDDNPEPHPGLFCLPRTDAAYLDLVNRAGDLEKNTEILTFNGVVYPIVTISMV